jgi:hypothetical protein
VPRYQDWAAVAASIGGITPISTPRQLAATKPATTAMSSPMIGVISLSSSNLFEPLRTRDDLE